jgi:SulP family sulfate permease
MIAIVVIRVFLPTHPATLWAMLGGIGLSTFANLKRGGMLLVHDLAPVPPGLPPLSLPQLDLVETLFPAALATALLSSVEATAISRNIASRTGQRLDTARDFVGLGLANLTAGLTSGYPVSGSLSRSALNERAGTTTRLGGTASGLWMLMVLIAFGPIVDLTPVPSLAGILLVTAADLIDTRRIREILASSQGDRLAFLVTVIGTWTLSLERAILLGAGISIALFLRRARHLLVRELEVDALDRLRVRNEEEPFQGSTSIRVLHIEGNLFFGAASELQRTLDSATRDRDVRVLILRLRRTQAMDVTTAYVLLAAARAMQRHDRHLLLVGIRPRPMEMLVRTGIAASWGEKHLFPSQAEWFGAMDSALAQAVDLANTDAACPFRRYLRTRESQSPL